jgi:hypothetical protein
VQKAIDALKQHSKGKKVTGSSDDSS